MRQIHPNYNSILEALNISWVGSQQCIRRGGRRSNHPHSCPVRLRGRLIPFPGPPQRQLEIDESSACGQKSPDAVSRLVLRDALSLDGTGAAMGLAGGLATARFLKSFLFGVTTADPATFAAAVAVLLTAALLASWLPARRAARVYPVEALRFD